MLSIPLGIAIPLKKMRGIAIPRNRFLLNKKIVIPIE